MVAYKYIFIYISANTINLHTLCDIYLVNIAQYKGLKVSGPLQHQADVSLLHNYVFFIVKGWIWPQFMLNCHWCYQGLKTTWNLDNFSN